MVRLELLIKCTKKVYILADSDLYAIPIMLRYIQYTILKNPIQKHTKRRGLRQCMFKSASNPNMTLVLYVTTIHHIIIPFSMYFSSGLYRLKLAASSFGESVLSPVSPIIYERCKDGFFKILSIWT